MFYVAAVFDQSTGHTRQTCTDSPGCKPLTKLLFYYRGVKSHTQVVGYLQVWFKLNLVDPGLLELPIVRIITDDFDTRLFRWYST